MSDRHSSGAPWRNFYGRRHGKTLRPEQLRALREDLGALTLRDVEWDENPDRVTLDMERVFGGKPVWLEVGFGGGEHLVHQAALHPEIAFIGCEPFMNGVAMLLNKIARAGVNNIHIHPGDARDLFDVLPKQSISRAFLLYPDPWPKARHHRRRFVTPEHLGPLAASLRTDAIFRVATDIEDYVRQTMEEVPPSGFEWLVQTPSDWRKPWADWLTTRYEQKALREGRVPHYMTFRRV